MHNPMNMNNSFYFITTVLLGLIYSSVQGQRPHDSLGIGGRERILKLKEEFILKRIPFSAQESENFTRVFREFEQRRRGLMRQLRENRFRLGTEGEKLSSDDINRLLDQRLNLERLLLEEKERFIKNLRQIFPPERVMEILRAEKEFMRTMLHKMKEFPPDIDEPGPPLPPHHPHHRPGR